MALLPPTRRRRNKKAAHPGSGPGGSKKPEESCVRSGPWRLRPGRRWPGGSAGSGPAPVLVVASDHLAVQLLLFLLERVLHLLPLQTTVPDERKRRAGCKSREASRPPCAPARCAPSAARAAPTRRSPAAALRPGQVRSHRPPVPLPPGEAHQSRSGSLVTVASETGPGPVGPTLSTLQLSPLPWGQSSLLLSRVLSNCSHLPRS